MFEFLRSRGQPMPASAIDAGESERVSVVVPLYNHARYFKEMIESALSQGPLLHELIIVDDGSSDESPRLAADLSASDPRVVFWREPNRGAHAAINAGIMRSTGERIAILNSDDVFEPNRLRVLCAQLDADPACDLVASAVTNIDGSSARIDNAWYRDAVRNYETSQDLPLALINGNFIMTTSNFLFRRRLIDRIGLFRPFRYAHDVDFLLRAIADGAKIGLNEQPLLRYRVHGTNTIGEDHSRVRVEWALTSGIYLDAALVSPEGEMDWKRYGRAQEILARHRLTDAVGLCLAYLRRNGSVPNVVDRLLRDGNFLDAVRAAV